MADDDSVEFSVVLHSATDVCTRSLCVPTFPETVGDLQSHIETKFSVPRCCQSVVFEGNTLHGDDTLRIQRVRSGDTFHIYYKSDADVEEIRNVVDSMQKALALIENFYDEFQDYYNPKQKFCREKVLHLIRMFEVQIDPQKVDSLATHYFQPFGSDHTMANRFYFIDIDGLKVLHSLYSMAVKYPWEVTVVTLQYLELAILRVLENISATFAVQSTLLQYPIVELCVKSALRVPVEYRKRVVAPAHLAHYRIPSTNEEQEFLLSESLYKAIAVLFNLTELSHYQVQIASEARILDRATLLALCPSYHRSASLVTVSGMVCLAYNRETHQYLVKDNILKWIQELRGPVALDKAVTRHCASKTQDLLRYFVALLYALIIGSSVHLIPKGTLNNLCWFIQEVLSTASPDNLHNAEEENGYVWSTLRPHFNLAYMPLSVCLPQVVLEIPLDQMSSFLKSWGIDNESLLPLTDNFIVHYPVSLQPLCVEIGILSLQNMLLREETRQVLVDEELVDYVVCLPWSLPQGTQRQQRACKLVKSLGSFMKLEPPSLVNIARAKLAADTFGLEQLTNTYSVHDLIHKIT